MVGDVVRLGRRATVSRRERLIERVVEAVKLEQLVSPKAQPHARARIQRRVRRG